MKTGALNLGSECLVPRVRLADRWFSRLRGLLGRPPLAPGEGLLLRPCASVHTCFMGYPLDLVFLDRDLQVLATRACVRPWRGAGHRRAYATLELPGGSLDRLGLRPGQHLDWRPTQPAPAGSRAGGTAAETGGHA